MSGENYIQPSEIEASWQQFLAAGEVASERRLRHLFDCCRRIHAARFAKRLSGVSAR